MSQPWDGSPRNLEESRIDFNPDAIVPDSHRRGDCGAAAHEGVKHDSDPQGECGTNDLPHECLRLKRGVRGNRTFLGPGGRRADDIFEWPLL